MKKPKTPLDAYKSIMDQIVKETCEFGSSPRVMKKGIFSNAPDHQEFNEFIKSLSKPQRELLARMLQSEREEAVGGVLATFSWWIDCQEVTFRFRGDYVGRRDGWEWPTNTGDE